MKIWGPGTDSEEIFGKQKVFGDAQQKQKLYLLCPILISAEIHFKLNSCNLQAKESIIYTKKSFAFIEKHYVKWKEHEKEIRNP